MPPEELHPETQNALIIRRETALALLSDGGTPALSEIVKRSLVHIQTSKALGIRHRVGEQELFGPDYRLVCAFAEDLRLTPEEILRRLLLAGQALWNTKIEDGRFKALRIDEDTLPVSSIPSIAGLVVESLQWWGLKEAPTGIDFSMFPHLTRLDCSDNQLTDLDLSQVPNLTVFSCNMNPLTKLDLSRVPNLMELHCQDVHLTELDLSGVPNLTLLMCYNNQLTELDLSQIPNLTGLECVGNQLSELNIRNLRNLLWMQCSDNQLTELDLAQVPNLTDLYCNDNQLTELDLSQVINLRDLHCDGNQLTELDIRNLRNLKTLSHDENKTRLIQRPDQNFK